MALQIKEPRSPIIENEDTQVRVLFVHSEWDRSGISEPTYRILEGTVKEVAEHIIGMTSDAEDVGDIYAEYKEEHCSADIIAAICDGSSGEDSFDILYI